MRNINSDAIEILIYGTQATWTLQAEKQAEINIFFTIYHYIYLLHVANVYNFVYWF